MKRSIIALAILLLPCLASAASFTRPLSQGMQGADVIVLQEFLKARGYLADWQATGLYGPATAEAVAKFQRANGLEPVGNVGPKTLAVLNRATAPKARAGGSSSGFLSLGSRGADVSILQDILRDKGFLKSESTGYFGALTKTALEAFQIANGLEPVGYMGPKTKSLLVAIWLASAPSSPSAGTVAASPSAPAALTTPASTQNSNSAPNEIFIPPVTANASNSTNTHISNSGNNNTSNSTNTGNSGSTSNFGSGPFAQYFTSGVLSIPSGENPAAASKVTVNSDFTHYVTGAEGQSLVDFVAGTIITRSGGGTFDATALTASEVIPTGGPGSVAAVGGVQLGVPGVQLAFSSPVTLEIFVGTDFSDDEMDVYRAESSSGPWTQSGITGSPCIVTEGLCDFDFTSASIFALFPKP